jgi:hypothetical protein
MTRQALDWWGGFSVIALMLHSGLLVLSLWLRIYRKGKWQFVPFTV